MRTGGIAMGKRTITVLAGLSLTAGLLSLGAGARAADTSAAAPKPPKGARAVVQVSPNPTTERGQEVTITGHCGGGKGLRAVLAGLDRKRPVLENVRIIEDGPKKFVAKATLSATVGNGVGPVLVDCGGEAGVTLLVTRV
ncbi:hypothetical protein ACBJ59_51280 [Nonomuraea sp. MTCD27]|uniref:hypothetical protein n=1 Tax=Nonomuraea sp. MTCD27 TaxID=1676747 RepID=UPI0035BF2E3F